MTALCTRCGMEAMNRHVCLVETAFGRPPVDISGRFQPLEHLALVKCECHDCTQFRAHEGLMRFSEFELGLALEEIEYLKAKAAEYSDTVVNQNAELTALKKEIDEAPVLGCLDGPRQPNAEWRPYDSETDFQYTCRAVRIKPLQSDL